MNKKIFTLIIFLILMTVVLPVSSIRIENVNVKYEDDLNEVFKNNIILDDYPVMNVPLSFIEPDELSPKPLPKSTPDEFSWANYKGKDWTTPTMNQGPCGSCWACAALGSLESVIKIEEDCADFFPDLSEQYILSCLPKSGSCRGGSTYEAYQLIKDTTPDGNYHNGVIFEECIPYKADDDIPCSDKCEDWEELLVPIFNYSSWRADGTDSDIERIKTQIIEKGPVVAHMKAIDNFMIWGALNHDPNAYFLKIMDVFGINHVVVIIGWKESNLIPKGGYWICKNSWGPYWGYDGFFNLVYGSLNIDKYWIISPDYDPDSFDWSPVVDTGGSYGEYLNQEVTFDASGCVGVEGEIIDYSWDFGDDTTGSGVTSTHTYTELDKYTVKLTVTDNENNEATGTTYVWIQETNEPPNKPTIMGTTPGRVDLFYEYTFSSIDPEGNDLWYLVNWDDGTDSGWIGPYPSGEEVSLKHSWDKKGTYAIQVKSKDVFNEESDIAELPVTMPLNKLSFRVIFYEILERLINTFSFFRYIW